MDYNGVVYGNDWWVGSVVRYACRPGFMLLGTPTRSCQPNGVWTPKPMCLREYTPNPGLQRLDAALTNIFFSYLSFRNVLAGEDRGEREGAQRHMQLHLCKQELLRPTQTGLHPYRQL